MSSPNPAQLDALTRSLSDCMLMDQHRLRGRIHAARGRIKRGEPADRILKEVAADIEKSRARHHGRMKRRPTPHWPENLPVVARRQEIAAAIRDHQVVIVCGETGSGKTTQIPKICLELGRGVVGLIGHTQPRRIAARTLAARIAEELRAPLGQAVGYKIRFTDETSPNTYIKIMTDGILLAETQGDRMLDQYDTIIIDEAHERSINIDFLLGYLKQLLPKRPDLKIIITSATIDPKRFSEHFNNAPIIEVSGRVYPVETRYRPLPIDDPDKPGNPMREAIVDAVDEAIAAGPGDILIFLPGERDIRLTAKALRKHELTGTEVLPFYARLSSGEQNKIFRPHRGRRIVLATNVAETSITVPGIRYVIDPGLARMSRYNANSGVQRLPIERVSQASSNQRLGRCGRLSDGMCIRLFFEEDFKERDEFTSPEILRTNLASVILQMKALNLGAVEDFPFVERPKPHLVNDGYSTLRELGAVDENRELTDIGRTLSRLPIDPRLGRMLLAANEECCLAEVLPMASALSVQDPRERPMDQAEQADAAHAPWKDESSDYLTLLNLWRFYHEQKEKLSGSQLRKCCRQNFLSFVRMLEWTDIHRQIRSLAQQAGWRINSTPADSDAIHRALVTGLLSHIGERKEGYEYTGAHNMKFHIFPGSVCFEGSPRWVMAAELVETTKLYARTVAPIQPAWLEDLAPHLIKRSYSDPHWQPKSGHVGAFEKVTLFGLEIVTNRRVHYGPINPEISRELFIRHALVDQDFQTKGPFARHNAQLIDDIEKLEAKARRQNMLVDEHEIFAFYDARVPADIYDGPAFEKWRKKAERENPKLLLMERDDILRSGAADAITAELFPDQVRIGSSILPLKYTLNPGHTADGLTITVPVEAVGQLTDERLAWLVPGFLEEKIFALLKALPKQWRTCFLPTAEVARESAVALAESNHESLIEALAAHLHRTHGIEVPREIWKPERLADHLHMNMVVVDDRGRQIASGRSVGEIRRTLGPRLAAGFASHAASKWKRDGCTTWDFGELPEEVEIKQRSIRMTGYPTLIDRETSVSIATVDSRAEADLLRRHGLRRLFMLKCRDEIRFQLEHLPRFDTLCIQYTTLGNPAELKAELADLIADRAFFGDGDTWKNIRNEKAFGHALDQGWSRITQAANESGRVVGEVLNLFHAIDRRLADDLPAAWDESLDDIEEQLGYLFKKRFLSHTNFAWLRQFPRYLKAIERRFEKMSTGAVARDVTHLKQIAPHWQAWKERATRNREERIFNPQLEHYRWMIEEYRVSLFAQDLGTSLPVSDKRLVKQWDKIKGAKTQG